MNKYNTMIGQMAGQISDATGSLAIEAMGLLMVLGDRNRGAAIALGIGAVSGTLQTLASILGRADDGQMSSALTDDTVLFAALLTVASCHVRPDPNDAGNVVFSFEHCPASYLDAKAMFERLTGRDASTFLESTIVNGIKSNTNVGLDLLNQVCANRRSC